MAVINTIIPTQSFEVVRDRIGAILADEIDNQVVISYNTDIDATVYIERFISFDKTELPAINVCLARGTMSGQTAIQSDGIYTFNIDVYTKANTGIDQEGDSLAMIRLHKLIGICRAILEDSRYKTLGFVPPFVMNRHVEQIDISNPSTQDAVSAVMGRITFIVKVPENISLIEPVLISGYDTQVKLYTTERGYFYSA